MILLLMVLAWLVLSLPISLVIGRAIAVADVDPVVATPAPVRNELAAA